MKQSKGMSLLESAINIMVGLGVALVANAIILPALGFPITLSQNLQIAAFMTVISIARSFALRRLFEALHIRLPISPFMAAVIAERHRQVAVEGFDAAHDDKEPTGTLALAGASYAYAASAAARTGDYEPPRKPPLWWPFKQGWWKPDGFRRDLVKGCALIIAEGDRNDRDRHRPARNERAAI